jgi:Fe-S-cluster-containing hydrogenase component 2
MADKCGNFACWVSSEPFADEDYAKVKATIKAQHGKRFAVLECFQEIPCNPCEEACPRHAIKVGTPITNLPVLDWERCTGCGNCISKCPGQAIIVLDTSVAQWDRVSIPYEYLPLPDVGSLVTAADRKGKPVCTAKVLNVAVIRAYDKTAVVQLEVPSGMGEVVRGIIAI